MDRDFYILSGVNRSCFLVEEQVERKEKAAHSTEQDGRNHFGLTALEKRQLHLLSIYYHTDIYSVNGTCLLVSAVFAFGLLSKVKQREANRSKIPDTDTDTDTETDMETGTGTTTIFRSSS